MFENHIKIGTTLDYPPFTYQEVKTGQYLGFDIELIQTLTQNIGITVEFIKTTWGSLESDLMHSLFEIAVGGISLTIDRRSQFLTSSAILSDQKAFLINKRHYSKINNLSDIDNPNIRVIVNHGGTNNQFVQNNIRRAKIITLQDNLLIFDKLARGEADVMITDLCEANYRQRLDDRLYAIIPSSPLTNTIDYGYLFNSKHLKLYNMINAELKSFMRKDDFKTLHAKFFSPYP
ncbi:MAG: transporter substrate-binding domain-containing protein [Burkholderiales bacterium]|nr:transporter substrate-binding domain-containing protein [Burkholderiales bacterium]